MMQAVMTPTYGRDFEPSDASGSEVAARKLDTSSTVSLLPLATHGDGRAAEILLDWNDLNVGFGLDAGSGAPLTTLASNPAYDNSGEIPEGARGSGIQTIDGFLTTTPFRTFFDVHLDYTGRLPNSNQRLVLIMEAFNLFNNQDPDLYDYASERSFGVDNPNGPRSLAGAQPLNQDVGSFPSYNPPRAMQFGARYEW
jgi:hypothetical protein